MRAHKREVDPLVERALGRHLPVVPSDAHAVFNEALRYAVFPGGKRLRPVLTLLGAELVSGRREDVLQAAAAVGFLHNSSLVLDDLPCMDDATERRGRVALHGRYGEGVAVLVALALMNASYGLILSGEGINPVLAVRAHGAQHADRCVGSLVNEAKEVLTAEFGATRPALLLCALADYVAARNGSRTGAVAKTFN